MSGQPVHCTLFPRVSRATRIEVETFAENEFGLTRFRFVNIIIFESHTSVHVVLIGVVKRIDDSTVSRVNCSICNRCDRRFDLLSFSSRLNYFRGISRYNRNDAMKLTRTFERIWNGSFLRDLSNVRTGFFFFSLYRCLSNDILKRMKKGELKMKVPKDISRMILLKIFKLMKHEMFVIRGSFGLLNSKSKGIILIYVIIDMLYRNWFYVSYYWLNILHNKNIRTFNFFEWKIYALIISTLL